MVIYCIAAKLQYGMIQTIAGFHPERETRMLEITNVRHGAVLNRNHGRETAKGLEFVIEGLADPAAQIAVNGGPAERCDRNFRAPVRLTGKFNTVAVRSHSKFGDVEQRIMLVYDKDSFRRCNFFIDDNVFFLTDLAREKPQSLFDHFYLKALRDIHRESGARFTLNCFFRNDHDPFEISSVPDRYKGEWHDNADWLRLSFHAFSEFPDRPYQHAEGAVLAADYDKVRAEIVRFAGEATFIPPTVIHWGMTHPDNFAVLKERGVSVLAGSFISSRVKVGEQVSANPVADIGYFYEQDVTRYLKAQKAWYDTDVDLLLINNSACCNLDTPAEIVEYLDRDAKIGNDFLSLVTHEQYCFPRYFNYIPDHLDRIALACRHMKKLGYEFVFFAEGFLGNRAWDK